MAEYKREGQKISKKYEYSENIQKVSKFMVIAFRFSSGSLALIVHIGSNIDLCDLCDKEKKRPFAIKKNKEKKKIHLLHCYPVLI